MAPVAALSRAATVLLPLPESPCISTNPLGRLWHQDSARSR